MSARPDAELQAELDALTERLGMPKHFIAVARGVGPQRFGVAGAGLIVVPPRFHHLAADQREAILGHEIEHARLHRLSRWVPLIAGLGIGAWWEATRFGQPTFAWAALVVAVCMFFALGWTTELMCDRAAVRATSPTTFRSAMRALFKSRFAYAAHLVASLVPWTHPPLALRMALAGRWSR